MTDPNKAAVTESSSPRLEEAMGDTGQMPASEQYEQWKKYPNSYKAPTHEDWLRELASLRQKQVLWEAGNRELADRLEARDVAIDALRAEKERAEAERDEAIRMRDRHAEASKAQNEDITALMAERDAALKDAEAKLKAQAAEAYADVDEWAAYASEYFRSKWDLPGTLQKWRDRFEPDAARKGQQ